jgi:Rad3-related DNA helicase
MWNLYSKEKFLEPLCFSNGKSQADIVEEVLKAIERGKKTIFIHGVCGSGKSAIALNIARKLGKASIVVPIKNLQNQYKKDYEGEKYLKKENGEKLKISVITGRKNHLCKFLEDNQLAIPKEKKEINSTLDIFDEKRKDISEMIGFDKSADNKELPCRIDIKEKNWKRIRKYLSQNKEINSSEIQTIQEVKRASIAPSCPYWSPVLPEEYEFKQPSLLNAKKSSFQGISGKKYFFYSRCPGCTYYQQFQKYIDSDVLVFNSLKYKLESLLGRKPKTSIDIIDECDEFLDNFSNSETVSLGRLQNALIYAFGSGEQFEKIHKELSELVFLLKRNERINDSAITGSIIPLKETQLYDIIKIVNKNPEFFDELDDESYLLDFLEISRMFSGFLDETYLTVEKYEENLKLNLVTTNLAKIFDLIVGKNEIVVLMSGTLHSEKILKNIFGLKNFEIIEAEALNQGNVFVKRTGKEIDCKYSNFSCGKHTRREYLEALEESVKSAKKPLLVHVQAFKDLPCEEEKRNYCLKNIISREEIEKMQREEGEKLIGKFKNKEIDVLFSTRASRGIDFPGDECRSIIFTKYPNPNVQDAFWKILNRTHPSYYWDFYKDKAKRELWQKVYRGVRFKEDSVEVLSPDSRVLEAFEKHV